MVLSMGVPVFAATDNDGDETTRSGATITKEIDTATGVTAPTDKVFTFKIEPGTKVKTSDTETTVNSPKPAAATTVTDENETYYTVTKTGSGTTSDVFVASDFNSVGAGVYTYTVSEIASTDTTDLNNWTYDPISYTVRVKVIAGTNGALTIKGITAETTDGKQTAIKFNNDYTKWGNTDNGGNESNGLVVSKSIKGQGLDATDDFTFSITFNKGSIPDENKKVTSGSTTYEYGQAYTFTLNGGTNKSKAFKIPVGATYTVEEKNVGNAKSTTYSVNGGTATDGTKVDTTTITSGANTVAFENSSTVTPLTGVVSQYGGLIAVIAIAAAGMVILAVRRSRSEA